MTKEEATKYFERQLKYLPLGASDTVRRAYELAIEALSSERPKGRWIRKTGIFDGYSECSECAEIALNGLNVCPNCGYDMRGEEE